MTELAAGCEVILLPVHDSIEIQAPPSGRYPVTDGRRRGLLDLTRSGSREAYEDLFRRPDGGPGAAGAAQPRAPAAFDRRCPGRSRAGARSRRTRALACRGGLRVNGDPLAQLRDWHLPDPIQWWPPAPGWWISAAVFLALLLLGDRCRLAPTSASGRRRPFGTARARRAAGGRPDRRRHPRLRRCTLAPAAPVRPGALSARAGRRTHRRCLAWASWMRPAAGGLSSRAGSGTRRPRLRRAPRPAIYRRIPDALAELAENWIRANRRHGGPAVPRGRGNACRPKGRRAAPCNEMTPKITAKTTNVDG
jgi:hypothetical protein